MLAYTIGTFVGCGGVCGLHGDEIEGIELVDTGGMDFNGEYEV